MVYCIEQHGVGHIFRLTFNLLNAFNITAGKEIQDADVVYLPRLLSLRNDAINSNFRVISYI